MLAVRAGRRLGDGAGVGRILQFDGDAGGAFDRALEVDVAPSEVGGRDQPLPQMIHAAGHGDADAFASEPRMGAEERLQAAAEIPRRTPSGRFAAVGSRS